MAALAVLDVAIELAGRTAFRWDRNKDSAKQLPEGASLQLQDCFERTNWDIFVDQDLEVSGDRALYSVARTNLKRGIKEAKIAYKRKTEEHFTNNDPRHVWQGIQHITNHKSRNCITVEGDASLAEELNCFFARYEVEKWRQTQDLHQSPITTPSWCKNMSNTIIKFADDTTVVGLISGGDETAYRDEVLGLVDWCAENNLSLNSTKTKELVIDFRRKRADPTPLIINGDCVERVPSFRFLGMHISEDLTWTTNTTAVVRKAQQRLYFLRILRKNNLQEKLLVSYYRCAIESVLTYCISTWYSSCSVAERRALQRVISMAQKVIGLVQFSHETSHTKMTDSPGRSVSVFSADDVFNTTTLLLSKDEDTLFIGARNAILSLSLSQGGGLTLSSKLDWSPPEKDLNDCSMKGKEEMDCPNFVRVLQVVNSNRLYACGTFAFSPRCTFISSEPFSLVSSPYAEDGKGRCPYDPYQKNTAITVDGELYTGTVIDYRGNRPVISRHLSKGGHVDLRLEDGWLEEPTFISSAFIPSEKKVYFFFTETGRKSTVSRIAQVCTSDVGGQGILQRRWTTFTKAQLLCQSAGELPYNVLQDITSLQPPEGATEDQTLFYGIFSSQWSVNSGRSAVCVFSLKTIKDVFAGNYKFLNRDTMEWITKVQEKPANPGECGLHNASYNILQFLKNNFLAEQSVQPINRELTFVSPDHLYSNIAAQRVKGAHGKEYTVLYLLTENGFLHKAVILEKGAHIIEEIQVFTQPQRVRNLLLSVSKGVVLVGSSEGVLSVPVSNCSFYLSCADCVLARDPFCGWDCSKKTCAQISSITENAVQDVDNEDVSEVCKPPGINPRSHSMSLPTPADEVSNLLCKARVCLNPQELAQERSKENKTRKQLETGLRTGQDQAQKMEWGT
ncbi:semaphorin-4A-like [Hoplias malabaricus]|uniref:semaphorin-4A-like n=1 Tax=Hoplias malabaricus TaxID=27720 RepID=UPI003461D947